MNCENCKLRKYYANVFDIHFDEKDCPVKCMFKKEGANQ